MKYISELSHLLFLSCNNRLWMSLNTDPCFVLELGFYRDVFICCRFLLAYWAVKGHQ